MANINVFLGEIERANHLDSVVRNLSSEQTRELVNTFKNHLSRIFQGEIEDCWRDKIYKNGSSELFPDRTREYLQNFDKFGGFSNNQIKFIISLLRDITDDLDYALEVLLPEVIYLIIKDMFELSSEETELYMVDGGIDYGRRTVRSFRNEGRYIYFECEYFLANVYITCIKFIMMLL